MGLPGCASQPATSSGDGLLADVAGGHGEGGGTPDAVAYTGRFPAGTGRHTAQLTVAGVARTVEIYVPGSAGKSPPLLLTLHGTNDDPWRMVTASAAKELADASGVVVISPRARKMSGGDWDNHSGGELYWETHPSVDPNKNKDLLMIRALLSEARRAYGADPRRVYLLGHSNGAFFALLAGLTLGDRVAALAANAGGLVRCASTGSCAFKGSAASCATLAQQSGYCRCSGAAKPVDVARAVRKVPAYLSHAADDPTVSVAYTCEAAAALKAAGHEVKVAIQASGGHGMPYPLAQTAWSFLSGYAL